MCDGGGRASRSSWLGALVSVLSMVAAISTCSFVRKEAEKGIERIQFHVEIANDTLTFFQISGDSYHVPSITITPIFKGGTSGKPYIEKEPFNLSISKYINLNRPEPFYRIKPLSGIICGRQVEIDCAQNPLVSILISYEIFENIRGEEVGVE